MTKKTRTSDEPPAPRLRRSPPTILIVVLGGLVLVIGAVAAVLICRQPSSSQTQVQIKDTSFTVEIADTPNKRTVGLMFRKELPERTGMLFVFDKPDILRFWMRNTYVPLDIVFISPDRRIINIAPMPALTDETCSSERPALYVLELERGSAKRYGLAPGQEVRIVLPVR